MLPLYKGNSVGQVLHTDHGLTQGQDKGVAGKGK